MSGRRKGADIAICLTIRTVSAVVCWWMVGFHGFSNSTCEVGYVYLSDGAFRCGFNIDLGQLCNRTSRRKNLLYVEWTAHFQGSNRRKCTLYPEPNMVSYLGQGLPIFCYVVNPEVVIFRWRHYGAEAVLRPRRWAAMKACLVPSIAKKTKLALKH